MHKDCKYCFLKQAERLLERNKVCDETAIDIKKRFNTFLTVYGSNGLSSPEAACFLHKMIKKASGVDDLYLKEKEYYNNLMLGFEDSLRKEIAKSADPFKTALKYALAGNIIDFGPPREFDATSVISSALSKEPAVDHSELLRQELQNASTVLYLGDNAGEIVMDKLFIETIAHPNLYYAVRGGNIINDITTKDAEYVGIDKFAKVISNGYTAPSTILSRCSPSFRKVFNEAGLIISKGQGNLEGLINEKSYNIFFLLMVKCSVMADTTGVNEGDVVIMSNSRQIKN